MNIMDVRIKEVMCNLKNFDFEVFGAYKMDKQEAKKLLTALKESHFSDTAKWIPIEYDGCADGYPVWDKWECSKCGHEHCGDEDTLTAFCPDCGSVMEVETELI